MGGDTAQEGEHPSTVGIDAGRFERYGLLVIEDGETVVVYDRDDEAAWIQSDTVRSLADRR